MIPASKPGGCRWRALPGDFLAWQTVYTYFSVSRLHTIWVDGGFSGENFLHLVVDVCHWIVQAVLRPEEHKGFVLLPKR